MKFTLVTLIAAIILWGIACKHEVPLQPNTPDTGGAGNTDSFLAIGTCRPDTVYFSNTIQPMLSTGCALSGCHDKVTHQEELVLSNYDGIMRIVTSNNATESKLYKVITAGNEDIMPPAPHTPFSSAMIASIRKWIDQGAQNNQCISACDTSIFTYSRAVAPIISVNCKGCHNPTSLGGGVDLSNYNGVKVVALNGRLAGSINHVSGYVAMPQGGNKLPACQIKQIEKWVQSGATNN
ncbi:c-type cytochrome domain-containing protein [Chitinophaga sp. CF418]|uniref:c-type cytochrome domain-containing protein n=1 Tax=Chitinophaga sp. CF418 TaxID=1855287 RepID=UPI00165F4E62|nr:c-type cytochrome domain-containing protein [Chitinophaga sp. CF418]